MLRDYMEERRTGIKSYRWKPFDVRFDEELNFGTVYNEEYALTLTVCTKFRSSPESHHAARDAAERKLVAYLFADARAHLEAIASALESDDKDGARIACEALRGEIS